MKLLSPLHTAEIECWPTDRVEIFKVATPVGEGGGPGRSSHPGSPPSPLEWRAYRRTEEVRAWRRSLSG